MMSNYNRWEKMCVYFGGSTFVSTLSVIALSLPYLFMRKENNGLNMFITSIAVLLLFIWLTAVINIKKYRFIESEHVVTYKRAVIIDTLVLDAALLLFWVNQYIPMSFTWDELVNPNLNEAIIPVGAMVICLAAFSPTVITNRRVFKYAKKHFSLEDMGEKNWEKYHVDSDNE